MKQVLGQIDLMGTRCIMLIWLVQRMQRYGQLCMYVRKRIWPMVFPTGLDRPSDKELVAKLAFVASHEDQDPMIEVLKIPLLVSPGTRVSFPATNQFIPTV